MSGKIRKCKICGKRKPIDKIITYNNKKKICIKCVTWLEKTPKEKTKIINDIIDDYPKNSNQIPKMILQRDSYGKK